jgi:hypothetical protein
MLRGRLTAAAPNKRLPGDYCLLSRVRREDWSAIKGPTQ